MNLHFQQLVVNEYAYITKLKCPLAKPDIEEVFKQLKIPALLSRIRTEFKGIARIRNPVGSSNSYVTHAVTTLHFILLN
jgi:hypothetical protein